jgi:hypothetical protein
MESAAELHEARVLRARIEVKEAELAGLSTHPGESFSGARPGLAAEIDRLKAEYRRLLARQADLDYRRRRAEWRAQKGAVARRGSACACA